MEHYFDYAAGTPVSPEVLEDMKPYFSERFHNPSSIYTAGRTTYSAVDDARHSTAQCLGVRKEDIIFTSGCTEANNLAIQGVMRSFPDKKVLMSAMEHDSVRRPAELFSHDYIPVTTKGVVDLEAFERLLDEDVVLVSVMYINNEIGTVQPLRKIAERIQIERDKRGKEGLPLYFHCDAAQAPNTHPITISATCVDLMSVSGAKMYGPKGIGCLYIARNTPLVPLLLGGGQERGLRSGTENVALIQGFSTALREAVDKYKSEQERLSELTRMLRKSLEGMGGILLTDNTPSITSVRFEGTDNEYLVYALDTAGFMVSSGSACHASSSEESSVLQSLGLTTEDARETIRISLGRHTTMHAVDALVQKIKEILANKQA